MSDPLYVTGPALSPRQIWLSALNGAVLWLAAALLLRWLGPMGIHDGSARVILYALVIPGTYPFNLLIRAIAGLQKGQMVPALALGTAVATLLDGVALACSQPFMEPVSTCIWGLQPSFYGAPVLVFFLPFGWIARRGAANL